MDYEKQGEKKPVNRLKTTAGNWYVCEMEVMNENMTTAFHRGEVYYCPKDGYIDVNGALFEVGTLDVFRLATKEEIPQQKQEWSEEDEAIIDYLLQLINNSHKEPCTKGLIAFGAEAWLKSLRPHFCDYHEGFKKGFAKAKEMHYDHWKPSDIELEALRLAAEKDGVCLMKLYEQLKKRYLNYE